MPPAKPSDFLFATAPYLFVLLWATGFIGVKYGIPYAEPLTFLLLRVVFTAAILVVVVLVSRAPWPQTPAAALHSAVSGMLIHGVYLGGVFWALARGMPVGIAALIVGVQPLLTALAARLLLKDAILPMQWGGVGIGFVGLSMVLAPKLGMSGAAARLDPLSVLFCVTALCAITAGTIYQKVFAADAGLRTGGLFQYIGAGLLALLGVLAFEEGRVEWTAEFIFALVWLVVVLSLGAISLLMILIRYGAIARVAALFYLVPPVTALFAYLIFGETLTAVQIAGIAVTAFSVWLASGRPPR